MLALDVMASTPRRDVPFDWAYVRHAIPVDDAAALMASVPDDVFWHLDSHDGEKHYRYAARPLVLLGEDAPWSPEGLAPAWRSVADMLLSPAYRSTLGGLIGRSLEGAGMEASVWRWGRDSELGPHLDLPSKIVTQVIYLNAGWDPSWGGCLRILNSRDPDDVHAELPPALGSASVLVRSDCSWHSVTPVSPAADAERLSLIVTWFHPGSTSPAWTVDADGAVDAPGGATRREAPHA